MQPSIQGQLYRQNVELKGYDSVNNLSWKAKQIDFEVGRRIDNTFERLMIWKVTDPPVNIPEAGK